jgi:hypothetical protein
MVNDACRHYISDSHDVDSTLKDRVRGYLRSRNYVELASCSQLFDWAQHTVNEFRFLRQVEAFYKKNVALSNGAECTNAALGSFFEAEEVCSETNRRLLPYVGKEHLLLEPYRTQVNKMKHYISSVLGDYDSFIDDLPSLIRVTAGATAHSARADSLPQFKMKHVLWSTPRARRYLCALYRFYGFNVPMFRSCHRNRVETVPKNWKTDRTIACEPEGNLPLQLAFDTWAKQRLKLFGINLSDQSLNQRASARASAIDGDVTVDFSKASDTIAYNVVSWLFPVDWYRFLSDVRSPGYRIPSVAANGVYAKFSSMGNGSTFAIETLLFAAACHAVGARNFLVYGDDVIIGKEYYERFLSLTGFLGFTINTDKSFASGPFRESCGLDSFNGLDVTPVYVRQIDARKASQCHFVNTLLTLSFPDSKLEVYLLSLVQDLDLPLVPYSESTISGVWIDPGVARQRGILREPPRRKGRHRAKWLTSFKSFVPKTTRMKFVDSRGYYLWFLNKRSQVLFKGPWQFWRTKESSHPATQTSAVPVFRHAYVRKWVSWFPPANGHYPAHLVWWSELFRPPQRLSKDASVAAKQYVV